MRTIWSILGSVLVSVSALANTNDVINKATDAALAQRSLISPETLAQMQHASNQSSINNQSLIEQIIKVSQQKSPKAQQGQYVDGAVLFVSFSMPESLLFSLGQEAALYKIPVVIKGLIDGDFKKTIATFAKLQAHAQKSHQAFNGVSIDPIWFEQFHITAVPALVVTKRPALCGQELLCKEQTFDVVYGNASLKNSLQLIANKGRHAALLAQSILEQGHV
jgi:conjugal transfer pilus assembly protein TrbC